MFLGSLKSVSRKFQECFKEVSKVFQGSFWEISSVFQESFMGVSTKIEGCIQAKFCATTNFVQDQDMF